MGANSRSSCYGNSVASFDLPSDFSDERRLSEENRRHSRLGGKNRNFAIIGGAGRGSVSPIKSR
jgi:hypothetical protein